jgi:hypothetical protein
VIFLAKSLPRRRLRGRGGRCLRRGVVLGEDEGLRHERAAGEKLGLQRVLERLEHGADLRRDDDGAVELGRGVGEVFIEELLAPAARGAAAFIDDETFVHLAALRGDLGVIR